MDSVAVIGYGNQGRPHALNLRDSGVDVVVGLRSGSASFARVEADGLRAVTLEEAAKRDVVALMVPDESMRDLWADELAGAMQEGQMLLFAHGFAIHFGLIEVPAGLDVGLVSPKGAGVWVRRAYEDGGGLPALVGVHQDATGRAMERVMAYAEAIGSTRTGTMETTFRDECECDLFGEQAVLCGGIPALVAAGYQTLVEAGYPPEAAYLECVYEAKLIVDLMMAKGLAGMKDAISPTAAYGGARAANRLVTEEMRLEMKRLLAEIQSGEFAREWQAFADKSGSTPNITGAEAIDDTGDALRQRWPKWKPV